MQICCVNHGNYCGRGVEYVNKLYDMIRRNTTLDFDFHVFSEELTDGYHPKVIQRILPKRLDDWWGKLYLFAPAVFPPGERVMFFDLDTLIIGDIDGILSYSGQFGTLRDFYYPDRLGPAIISWEVSDYTDSIWQEWSSQGEPRDGHGDLWWINNLDQGRFAKHADKLQDLYPGQFVSFKANCVHGVPKMARVICFHGLPRPHDCDGWVSDVWRIDSAAPVENSNT